MPIKQAYMVDRGLMSSMLPHFMCRARRLNIRIVTLTRPRNRLTFADLCTKRCCVTQCFIGGKMCLHACRVFGVLVRCSASEWTVDRRSASGMGIWDSRFSRGTAVLMGIYSLDMVWCGNRNGIWHIEMGRMDWKIGCGWEWRCVPLAIRIGMGM